MSFLASVSVRTARTVRMSIEILSEFYFQLSNFFRRSHASSCQYCEPIHTKQLPTPLPLRNIKLSTWEVLNSSIALKQIHGKNA